MKLLYFKFSPTANFIAVQLLAYKMPHKKHQKKIAFEYLSAKRVSDALPHAVYVLKSSLATAD